MSALFQADQKFEAQYLRISPTNSQAKVAWTAAYSSTVNLDHNSEGELEGIELFAPLSQAQTSRLVSDLELSPEVALELRARCQGAP
ncbi:MAG: hypothetical protein EBV30_05695 [Actinobacteria bacterium]|jgi:hypothetical protein|nr:hypothetical protein [Actinomycetota bacterium]